MTDTSAHTPGPWVIDKYGSVTHGRECVSANGFSMVMSPGDGQNEAKANAAFIVRACNSHYQLVESLREAIEELWDRDHSSTDRIQFERDNASLFAALSHAGGASE